MSIFDDDVVLDSLSPEQKEVMKDLEAEEEGQNTETTDSQEGPAEEGQLSEESPSTKEGQPSTEETTEETKDPLAKFTSDFALAKSYVEIKKALGESNDLEQYKTKEELGKAYLEAERRLGSRGKAPTTIQPQPEDERYSALQQQLAQTQGIVNHVVSLLVQQAKTPEKAQEPQISKEDQEFIQSMEEDYPGFTKYMEQLIMKQVKPQLEPVQQLADEYKQNVKYVQGWQAVAARNSDFKDLIPDVKTQITQLAQENPALLNALQQQPEALYEYAYARAKAGKVGQLQQQVSTEVSSAMQKAAEEQAKLEAQKQTAAMPKPGVKTTPKQKTIEEAVTEEILQIGQGGGGIFSGLI